jgi:hypothetical protein
VTWFSRWFGRLSTLHDNGWRQGSQLTFRHSRYALWGSREWGHIDLSEETGWQPPPKDACCVNRFRRSGTPGRVHLARHPLYGAWHVNGAGPLSVSSVTCRYIEMRALLERFAWRRYEPECNHEEAASTGQSRNRDPNKPLTDVTRLTHNCRDSVTYPALVSHSQSMDRTDSLIRKRGGN